MTGLKSGSGDDLWSDESADQDSTDESADREATDEASTGEDATDGRRADEGPTGGGSSSGSAPETGDQQSGDDASESGSGEDIDQSAGVSELRQAVSKAGDPPIPGDDAGIGSAGSSSADERPYVVRRAIRDKSVQFEREERLTFFVHDDVAEGERALISEVEAELGRDVPTFDVREAVYRAALRNPADVLDELLEMGYTVDRD